MPDPPIRASHYHFDHGPGRAAWHPRTVGDAQEVIPRNPRGELVVVDGLTHRRTARDPGVIRIAADFVAPSI